MDKIKATMILEILGKPADHVKESLESLVSRLGAEKGLKILNKTINEPLPVEGSKDLFTSFAEIDLEFETLDMYLAVVFAYMPSNVEIIYPEKMQITNAYLNEVGNKIIQRLHNYDAITKKILGERDLVFAHFKEHAPNAFSQLMAKLNSSPVQKKEDPVKEKSSKKNKK